MRPESSGLVPKLLLGNAVLEARLRRAAFAATQYSRLHRFNRGGHLYMNWVGKRSFQGVRSQAGAWERGLREPASAGLGGFCHLDVLVGLYAGQFFVGRGRSAKSRLTAL